MTAPLALYHEHLPTLSRQLAEAGNVALVVLDLSALASVEDEYGTDAFEQVRQRVINALAEQRGREYREDDVLVVDGHRALRFILFLSDKRRRSQPHAMADLRATSNRFVTILLPSLMRAAFPYVKSGARFEVGYGLAVYNPLMHADRSVRRAVQDAIELAAHHRRQEQIHTREKVQDLLVRDAIVTAYQPILHMGTLVALGYEALSRGPRGSGLEAADLLFEAATEHQLLIELDRLCRRRALLSSSRVPAPAKVFVNTLPATIRDPQFRGKALIGFLQRANLSPNRIVIEITEKLVIDNYTLFREEMDYFSTLGMSFAVDDVGSGYSGLEAIARLKPSYLKIDMALVRDVHVSVVNREMVKAIVALGNGIGSTVIAEGIQAVEEMETLQEMGIEYGQGFLLARPDAGSET